MPIDPSPSPWERLLEWGGAFLVFIALSFFHSPWWVLAVAGVPGAAIACRLLYRRWPWSPRPTIQVGGEDYILAEAVDFLKASEFFALARSGAKTAAKGPKSLLSSMIGYACRGPSGPDERAELAALLHRTASACAACGTMLPDSFQNAEWLKVAGSSFAVMSPSGSEGIDACLRCGGSEFLFLHPSPANPRS
jgi:hypothetical protein